MLGPIPLALLLALPAAAQDAAPTAPPDLASAVPVPADAVARRVHSSPRLPAEAREMGIAQATCDVRFYLDERGIPIHVQAEACPSLLQESALTVAWRLEFYPVKDEQGRPQRVTFVLPLRYGPPSAAPSAQPPLPTDLVTRAAILRPRELAALYWAEVRPERMVAPPFPTSEAGRDPRGSCTIQLSLDAQGVPTDAEATTCDGAFQDVSVEAAREWRFAPADGHAGLPPSIELTFEFRNPPPFQPPGDPPARPSRQSPAPDQP